MSNRIKLQQQLDQIDELQNLSTWSEVFKGREKKTKRLLNKIYWEQSIEVVDFENITFHYIPLAWISWWNNPDYSDEYYMTGMSEAKVLLQDFIDELEDSNFVLKEW